MKEEQARLRKRENELKKIENDIGEIEDKIEELSNQMNDPVIASDISKLLPITKELDKLNSQLEILYEKWDELS